MSIFLSAFVALAGLLLYAFAGNPKVQECGRLSFVAGLLVFLLHADKVIVAF